MSKPNAPKIEEWFITTHGYSTPSIVCGKIYHDPRWPDGTLITTGTIQDIDPEATWVQTRRTYYTLGAVKQEWLDWAKAENGYSLQSFITAILRRIGKAA